MKRGSTTACIKAFWKKARKPVKAAGAGLLALHLGTQAAYWFNDAWHTARPSKARIEFQQAFDIPLRGWSADIEDNEYSVASLGEVFHRRSCDKKHALGVSSFRIESPSYLKKSLVQQAGAVFIPHLGYFMPLVNAAHADARAGSTTQYHEINHGEVLALIRKHPEFEEKWRALAVDASGESLYRNPLAQVLSRIRGLQKLVPKEQRSSYELIKLGFISEYAQTSFLEDVAELCAEANDSSHLFALNYFRQNDSAKNKRIQDKVRLAEAYGLVPAGISEYADLMSHYNASFAPFEFSGRAVSKETFIDASDAFLKKHPRTSLEIVIRNSRLRIMQELHKQREKYVREDVLEEYQRLFACPFKERENYAWALDMFREFWQFEDEPFRAEVCSDALRLFYAYIKNKDVNLSRNGVNYFLEEKGLLAP
ncbi:hypothetical protein HYZ97_00510 [Candidatus Pacearchaeota archaeon]|nr:hypothetical protein [Candidatus Pacearchaeota archaeon]